MNAKPLAMALIFLLGGFLAAFFRSEKAVTVPLQQLLEKPEAYHRKVIVVRGFFINEFENSALYRARLGKRSEGIWVTPTPELAAQLNKFSGQFVALEGAFDATKHGHLGEYRGTIVVARIEPSKDRTEEPNHREGTK